MLIRTTLVALLALCSYAQGPGSGRGPLYGPGGARFLGAEPERPGRVVKGAPYTGDLITERTQTLADGNHIHQTATARVYRDSDGRTRREQSLAGIGAIAGNSNLPQVVFIDDPVAGVNYALNPSNHTASKSTWGGRGRNGRGPDSPPPPPDMSPRFRREATGGQTGNTKTELLGRQTTEGVPADGTRVTLTIPAGQIGNEQPVQVVTERWYSPDLQMYVVTRVSDPRSGETVTRLTNINRAEPAHTMFEVPSDFKVSEGGRPMPRPQR
jgi:hypothetical protein